MSSIVLSYELRNVNIHPDSFKGFKRRVTMEQGEMRKTVSIPIQDNPYWNVEEVRNANLCSNATRSKTPEARCPSSTATHRTPPPQPTAATHCPDLPPRPITATHHRDPLR